MLKRISSFATGRRSKWVVIAAWVIVGFALFGFQPKLQEATTNENEAFLPESAESTEVNDILGERFEVGNEVDALVAYNREDGGLGKADFEEITADSLEVAGLERPDPSASCERSELKGVLTVVDPTVGPVCGADELPGAESGKRPDEGPEAISDDGSTALLLVRTNADESDDIIDNVETLREIVPDPNAGAGEMRAYVTGIAGIIADSIEVFESIDTTLLLVTVALVLVLLLAIYRSPVVALVPLFVVAIAYGIAAAAVYGLVQAGAVEVNGQTTSLLTGRRSSPQC
jgi:RND superfamily putative drug exporter